jgi:hypothetical protein
MTAYRFRVNFEPDPTSLWRDIVVGATRTITEFQAAINPAFGLDQDHRWFVGTDEDYWDSPVKYQSPQEYGDTPNGGPLRLDEETIEALNVELRAELERKRYEHVL